MSIGFGLPGRLKAGLLIILQSFSCLATEAPASTSNEDVSPARVPFSAILVEYSKNQKGKDRRTRLYLGNEGMRSESLLPESDEPNLIVIKNYKTDQMWLINPAQKYVAEIPKDKAKSTKQAADEDNSSQSGVLVNTPCYGMSGEKQSARVIGDTELSVWQCKDVKGVKYIQHYSTLLGVVIRQESQDGHIVELQEITLLGESTGFFKPSNRLQEISIGELLAGRMALPDYVE